MTKLKVEDRKSCWFFHRWKTVKDNGFTIYEECKDCNARQVRQRRGGYQPVNFSWLNGKTDKV